MAEWLYLLKPTRLGMLTAGSTPEEDAIVGRHFAYLEDLTQKGVMILVGRTLNEDDSTFGIAVFEAADEVEARRIMESDPAIREGVMTATLFPYRIALMRK